MFSIEMNGQVQQARGRVRIKIFLVVLFLAWILLVMRLCYWQILSHDELSDMATSQYQVVVEGMDTRGAILDRNLQPLTGGSSKYYFFIQKSRIDSKAEQLLAKLNAKDGTGAASESNYRVFFSESLDEEISQALREEYGAYVFCGVSRYQDEQIACHLIGYLNQSENRGVSGLELLYEDEIGDDGRVLALWADGKGNLLLNESPKQEGRRQLKSHQIVTTIDKSLQKFCEAVLAEACGGAAAGTTATASTATAAATAGTSGASSAAGGAVLVSESKSGEILAWASYPCFNPNQIEEYLTADGTNLVNKCIQSAYAPGSVFKIVVAAAALEEGLAGEGAGGESVSGGGADGDDVSGEGMADKFNQYYCTGITQVNGISLGCQAGPAGGHGMVYLSKAMAVSCNCYFAELGACLGNEKILAMAKRLGFGELVFRSFQEEASGYLPEAATCSPWDTSNLSIGQGSLLVTPAQVHQMMSVIAAGGSLNPLHVVRGSLGDSLGDAGSNSGGRIGGGSNRMFSASVSRQLSEMLQAVMTEGTGASLCSNLSREKVVIGGKTGTAEASTDGKTVNHCWVSGFCGEKSEPGTGEHGNSEKEKTEPTFVITVLIEDGTSGSASAGPVFEKICEYLMVRSDIF